MANKIDFPLATADGQVFIESTTNVVYTYVGNPPDGYWSAYAGEDSENLTGFFVKVAGDNMTGNLTLGTDKITLNATDGSATFADEVTTETTFTAGTAGNGSIRIRTDSDIASFWVGQGSNTLNDATAVINGDGSATFAGNLTTGDGAGGSGARTNYGVLLTDTGGVYANRVDGSTSAVFTGRMNGNDTSLINADGSATFDGPISANIITGTRFITPVDPNGGAGTGISLNTSRGIEVGRSGGSPVFRGWKVGTADATSEISSGGSATFAGDVQSGGDANAGAANGVRLRQRGLVQASATGTVSVWTGYQTGTATATSIIYADGSADFAGTVTSANSFAIQLEADDDTKYTSTTDSEGVETRVYNGAVLDVKDRLTKADTALQSLKSAAAAATDFASLQSAIATALANI